MSLYGHLHIHEVILCLFVIVPLTLKQETLTLTSCIAPGRGALGLQQGPVPPPATPLAQALHPTTFLSGNAWNLKGISKKHVRRMCFSFKV